MSKERILELYLNVAEWGVGVFGAEAAAKHYFNTSAAGLGASQSARHSRHAPLPRFYDRNRSNYLNSRVGVLTRRMQMVDIPLNRTRPAGANPPALSRNSRQKYFRRRPHAGRPDLLSFHVYALFSDRPFSCVPPVATWPAKSIAPALWSFWPCWAFSRSSRWWTTWTTWARSSR